MLPSNAWWISGNAKFSKLANDGRSGRSCFEKVSVKGLAQIAPQQSLSGAPVYLILFSFISQNFLTHLIGGEPPVSGA